MPSVLIIDDNRADADLIKEALREVDLSVQVFSVENAVLGFAFLSKQSGFSQMPTPALVVLDINMPVITGLQALRLIRETGDWNAIPVMIWSSSSRREDREDALRSGAIEYVVKPAAWEGHVALAHRIAKLVAARDAGAAAG
ncbi:MAG TPA: response regulator [Planctomycetota bacterium]|nr:response regulator [Planctomycetota bacterium]